MAGIGRAERTLHPQGTMGGVCSSSPPPARHHHDTVHAAPTAQTEGADSIDDAVEKPHADGSSALQSRTSDDSGDDDDGIDTAAGSAASGDAVRQRLVIKGMRGVHGRTQRVTDPEAIELIAHLVTLSLSLSLCHSFVRMGLMQCDTHGKLPLTT